MANNQLIAASMLIKLKVPLILYCVQSALSISVFSYVPDYSKYVTGDE
jgi:hypothetical protein